MRLRLNRWLSLFTLAADAGFDSLITNDSGLEYEQNLDALPVAVIVLLAKANTIEAIRPLNDQLFVTDRLGGTVLVIRTRLGARPAVECLSVMQRGTSRERCTMGKSWADKLIGAGAFLLFFGAYLLFLKGPASNQQQQLFRIGIVVLGVILGVIGLVMKASSGRGGAA